MNSATTFTTSTTGSAATRQLGQTIGRLLRGGEMIELRSDIGGGKTTLVQGIAAGMGYKGDVSSPTFTLSRVYPTGHDLALNHFDLYRLAGHDTVTDELEEAIGDPKAVVVVEWADRGALQLPDDRLQITLTPGAEVDLRDITITSNGPQSTRILAGLQS